MVLGLAVSFYWKLIQPLGKPMYPGEDSTTEDGRIIDRYFGIKLFGGYHQSGEGPYIVMMRKPIIITYSSLTVV